MGYQRQMTDKGMWVFNEKNNLQNRFVERDDPYFQFFYKTLPESPLSSDTLGNKEPLKLDSDIQTLKDKQDQKNQLYREILTKSNLGSKMGEYIQHGSIYPTEPDTSLQLDKLTGQQGISISPATLPSLSRGAKRVLSDERDLPPEEKERFVTANIDRSAVEDKQKELDAAWREMNKQLREKAATGYRNFFGNTKQASDEEGN